jgi:GNAT superfamily N-acetyltransferase
MREVARGRVLPADLVARCHANALEDYRAFGRASSEGAIEEWPGALLVRTSSHAILENAAVVTEPPEDPRGLLDRARRFFLSPHRSWCVLVFPDARERMRPVLSSAGFADEGRFPGMLLRPIPSEVPPLPSDLRIEKAESMEQLEALEHAAARAYGMAYTGPDPRWLRNPGVSLYVGYHGDEVVAHGLLVESHGVAGVGYVGTVPEWRRRGFAAAIVWRIVADGRSRNCDAAYLWTTPLGHNVYAKMGFERILDYEIWSAPGCPLPPSIRRS